MTLASTWQWKCGGDFLLTVFVVDRSRTPAAICAKTCEEKIFKARRDPALSQCSIWTISAVLQCTRLAESYLTISCSIHERAIMYKRVSKACECAPCSPDKLQRSSLPQERKDVQKQRDSYYNNIKKQSSIIALASSLTSRSSSIWKLTNFFFLLCFTGFSLSGGHFVPRWFPMGSRRCAVACCCCCWCCWRGLWVTMQPMPEG